MGAYCTHIISPVQNCRKFSAVLGQMSAQSSILIRPAGCPPMVTSALPVRLTNDPQFGILGIEDDVVLSKALQQKLPKALRHKCLPAEAAECLTKEDDWIFSFPLS